MTEISEWTEPSFYQKPSETGELMRIDLDPIEPPLTDSEIRMFEENGLRPDTQLSWGDLPPMTVIAAIARSGLHFRVPGNPRLTVKTMLAYKTEIE